jgi:hypothetical protein
VARWRQAAARAVQDRRDVIKLGKGKTEREADPAFDPGAVVVVASVWLVFYLILAIHHFSTL